MSSKTHLEKLDRVRSILTEGTKRVLGKSEPQCKHITDQIHPKEDESIWHLQESYLEGEPYWSAHDAAFVKLRERVKKLKCLGCGEERTIKSGEVINIKWKENLSTEELAALHEETSSGSWFNGDLWWEDNVWDGDPKDVATDFQWYKDIGYTDWKEDSDETPTENNQEGEEKEANNETDSETPNN